MHRFRNAALACALCSTLFASGCAGPSKLGRALDQSYNQLYVDSPWVAEGMLPLITVGGVLAWVGDIFFVNPVYFWKDALEGQGTPYYYRPPVVKPMEEPIGS